MCNLYNFKKLHPGKVCSGGCKIPVKNATEAWFVDDSGNIPPLKQKIHCPQCIRNNPEKYNKFHPGWFELAKQG